MKVLQIDNLSYGIPHRLYIESNELSFITKFIT